MQRPEGGKYALNECLRKSKKEHFFLFVTERMLNWKSGCLGVHTNCSTNQGHDLAKYKILDF